MEEKKLTAQQLSKSLEGSFQERMEEEKSILLTMRPGHRPEVVFTGFWSGKFIRAAFNSISKAYRQRRYKPRRLNMGGKDVFTKSDRGGKEASPES